TRWGFLLLLSSWELNLLFFLWGHCSLLGAETEQPRKGFEEGLDGRGESTTEGLFYYDSHSRRMKPRVSWIEKVGKEDPQYWERETQISHGYEEAFRRNLGTLRIHYNQSEGLHIIEVMCVCEFRRDRSKGGVWQCGYEGMTFITFNKETFTWVAPDPQPPWVMLVEDGMEMYVCHLDGFYPRDIDRTLPWVCGTQRGWDLPYWLSIRIDPKERGRYRCHVEHDGLPEPLDLALEGERLQRGEGWLGSSQRAAALLSSSSQLFHSVHLKICVVAQ
uniref:MHC class I-like antigen recognition-like domain-containing protein n=1 Tax=Laticauda laticaudata TaxID=8630 RepID=A0A8C5S4X1_LATLA